jgi:hypothetical protein
VFALAVALAGVLINYSSADSAKRSAKAAEDTVGSANRTAKSAEDTVEIAKVSADAARESVIESRMARQDQLATDIFIQVDQYLGTRWIAHLAATRVSPAEPMETILNTPGNDDDQILVGVVVSVKNRSAFEAIVQVHASRVDRVSPELKSEESQASPAYGSVDSYILDGIFVIEPQSERLILVREGPTLREWMNDHYAPITVEISAHRATEGATQRWRLTFISPLLGKETNNESAFRVQPFLQVDAQLELLPREYPNLKRNNS